MRRLSAVALAGLVALASACAAKVVPAPVVTTPIFPAFILPAIPPELATSVAAPIQERAWRFLQAGDLQNAEHEVALALRVAPEFYPSETTAGYVGLARNDPQVALDHFDRALEWRADYVSAWMGRGQALLVLGRDPEAVAAFEAALAADPSLTDVRRQVEVLKFRGLQRELASARQAARAGRADEAIGLYRTAIERSPESAFLYRELAQVERQQGRADLALEHLRRAVALDPADAPSLALIGDLLDASGDPQGALRAYADALAIEPNESVEARREAVEALLERARLPEEYRAIDASPQVTRADLAALIGVRLRSVLQSMQARDAVVITDVRASWAEPWIMAVARAAVMEPYDNHEFQPQALVTRIDLAQSLSRLLEPIVSAAQLSAWQGAGAAFSDLSTSHLAYPAASIAVAAGVLAAEAGGSFQPSRLITGAEAVAAIDRLRAMAPPSRDPGRDRR